MTTITMTGGKKLSGEVLIQGSKNSVLPMIAASLLCKDITTIYNCPKISDVYAMVEILQDLGGHAKWYGHTLVLDTRSIISTNVEGRFTNRLRASVFYMGALLAREKKATLGYPGGCKIGSRPIDFHLEAFEKMHVIIDESREFVKGDAKSAHGEEICLKFPSVGATENVIMLAVLTPGKTIIRNAAKEPEILDLADFLCRMGAKITGAGTDTVEIEGVEQCYGCNYYLKYDRIVAGTYMLAAAVTRSTITLLGIDETERIQNIIDVFEEMGGKSSYSKYSQCLTVESQARPLKMCIAAKPHPGIPTDIQSMILTVLTIAQGQSEVVDCVFSERYNIVDELKKMGADIHVENKLVTINGVERLTGADVLAEDLRGGAALILAGLMSDGRSRIGNPCYMERGYESFVENLHNLGAEIAYDE